MTKSANFVGGFTTVRTVPPENIRVLGARTRLLVSVCASHNPDRPPCRRSHARNVSYGANRVDRFFLVLLKRAPAAVFFIYKVPLGSPLETRGQNRNNDVTKHDINLPFWSFSQQR